GGGGAVEVVAVARDHLAHQRDEIHLGAVDGEVARGDAGDVEQLADEAVEALAGLDHAAQAIEDAVEILGEGALAGEALEALDLEQERGERGLELVAGDGEEVVAQADGLLR